VTEATSTADSGIYCVRLLGGVDPSDAVVSAAGSAVGVYTVPASPDCAFGELEIDTFILVESTTTTPGTPAPPGSADGGFAAAHGPGCRFG
jgi:hypothetical protein